MRKCRRSMGRETQNLREEMKKAAGVVPQKEMKKASAAYGVRKKQAQAKKVEAGPVSAAAKLLAQGMGV